MAAEMTVWDEKDQKTIGPWFSYIKRAICPCDEDIVDILDQLKEGTSFFSRKGPRLIPINTGEVSSTSSSGSKVDKIFAIECIAKRRRNGNRWEYKLTNQSRREFLRKLSELVK